MKPEIDTGHLVLAPPPNRPFANSEFNRVTKNPTTNAILIDAFADFLGPDGVAELTGNDYKL